MNWAEQHIQKIETPKTKTKEYIEWGLKLLFTATGLIISFLAILFLIFENVETDESKEVQKWCAEYMPELSVRACRTEAGL
jgi:heme A synthase